MRKFIASKLKRSPVKAAMEPANNEVANKNNVVLNADFAHGLECWSTSYSCISSLRNASSGDVAPHSGSSYVAVSSRTQSWQGIGQDITPRVLRHVNYEVAATVRISGASHDAADVFATARLETEGSDAKYLRLGSVKASKHEWRKLTGTLFLSSDSDRVVVYLEGPPGGVDLLVDSVVISTSQDEADTAGQKEQVNDGLLDNAMFENGLKGWRGRGCSLILDDAASLPRVKPCTGQHFALATGRSQTWHGIEQEVTGKLSAKTMYELSATVRIHAAGSTSTEAEVLATLYIRKSNSTEQYITIGRAKGVSTGRWTDLQGNFTLHSLPKRAVLFLECLSPNVDILVDRFSAYPAKKYEPTPPPVFENPMFGENIVQNSNFLEGLSCWFPQGSCSLRVAAGAPKVLPRPAKESLEHNGNLSGNYLVASNRKASWEGPAQKLNGRFQVLLSYQVTAWVRVSQGSHKVNLAFSVDGQWVTGGEVDACSSSWKQIAGSIRLEQPCSNIHFYVQGPGPGVDIMLASMQIFSVDRTKRFASLDLQTDKLRKRDLVLEVCDSRGSPLEDAKISIEQTKSKFPVGSCIGRSSLENEDYVKFFLEHFDCTVFENELKWTWTEPSSGRLNYKDADELRSFCEKHWIPVRGHCVFWEVEENVQDWVKKLSREQLEAAVKNRITSLVSRYKGVFQHYDVNNEMLHGNFYESRLGPESRARMFQMIHQLDPSAKLFVNDYHVEGGKEAAASPQRYAQQVQTLVQQGAPVGGIGLQTHVDVPMGPILCQALDELAMLGLPVWLTELDVCCCNEHVRADDMEVVLREAFAHPAVEGTMLWGFWEGCCRNGGHLVEVNGALNEAGKRLLKLKQQWTTKTQGKTDARGKLELRCFHGSYRATVELGLSKVVKDFELDRGDGPLHIQVRC